MVMSLRTPRVLNYLTVMPHQSEACNKRLQIPGKAVQAEISKGLPHTKGSAIPGCGLKGTFVFLGERALRFLFFAQLRLLGGLCSTAKRKEKKDLLNTCSIVWTFHASIFQRGSVIIVRNFKFSLLPLFSLDFIVTFFF